MKHTAVVVFLALFVGVATSTLAAQTNQSAFALQPVVAVHQIAKPVQPAIIPPKVVVAPKTAGHVQTAIVPQPVAILYRAMGQVQRAIAPPKVVVSPKLAGPVQWAIAS